MIQEVEVSAQIQYLIFALLDYWSMPRRKFDEVVDELLHPILRILSESDGICCFHTFKRKLMNVRADLSYLIQLVFSFYKADICSSYKVDMDVVEKYTKPLSLEYEKRTNIWPWMD